MLRNSKPAFGWRKWIRACRMSRKISAKPAKRFILLLNGCRIPPPLWKQTELNNRRTDDDYRAAAAQYNEINLNVTRQQSKVQTLQQDITYKRNQLQNLEQQIQSNTKQLDESIFLIAESKGVIEETELLLAELQTEKEVAESGVNDANKNYYSLRNALQERESGLRLKIKSREISTRL